MLSPEGLIASGGLLLIGLIIFGESGLMIGFFFPGDTLLISAGVFAASGQLSLAAVIAVACAAAVAGDNTGYHIGRAAGPHLFRKKDGVLFRQEYVQKAHAFLERYGSKAMLLAHFVPVVRTFLPVVAGVGNMPHGKFSLFDAIGDVAWAVIVTLLGYYVGSKIPGLDKYILLLVLAAIIFSFTPVVYHLFTRKKRRVKTPPK
jgi:membrane-associated protein